MNWWQQVLLAVVSSGLLAVLVRLLTIRGERRKAAVDADAVEEETDAKLFDRVKELRTRVLNAEEHMRECEEENRGLHERVRRLEGIMPIALMAGQFSNYQRFADLLDASSDAWVVSAPANQGTILWVNQVFCAALGMTREAILTAGWRALIHPEDLAATSIIETQAWDEPQWGFVNRYRKADGSYALLRWFCPPYLNGITLSLVVVTKDRRKPATQEGTQP